MVCSAWFRERLRKVSLRKENDMVQDIDIKSKRILFVGLFTFLTCLSEPILKRFSRNGLMKERA